MDSHIAQDITEAVRDTAVLADIQIAVWGGERSDRALMDKVKADAGAVGNAGRVVKNLMSGADGALKDVRSAYAAIRSVHYELTLPWVSDPHAERQRGARLLPNALFDRYMGAIAGRRRIAMEKLDAFLDSYPADSALARTNLAGMAKPEDYPTTDDLRRMFRINFSIEPVPDKAGFNMLPPATAAKLRQSLERRHTAMLSTAMEHVWSEVRARVSLLAERLADPEAKFQKGTVEAVAELAGLVRGWNVAGDHRAAEVAADIEALMQAITPEELRKKPEVRANVATGAASLVGKLDAWSL